MAQDLLEIELQPHQSVQLLPFPFRAPFDPLFFSGATAAKELTTEIQLGRELLQLSP